jgi:DNA-binding NarL/FixJ family response regulator
MVRESLGRALGEAYSIVAMASGAEELFKVMEERAVDCVLLDLDLPGLHGLQLLNLVRDRYPGVKVVVVTMHSDQLTALTAVREGAHGYVPKDADIKELDIAIGEACAGRLYLSPRLSRERHRVGLEALHPGLRRLTPRQQEIVLLMGEGKSATAIAEALGVGQSTITFHKQNTMRTLGIASKDALVQFAVLVRSSVATGAGTEPGLTK